MGAVKLSEIFLSIQGESTFAGLPCVFIRLAGCNLDCVYCDTVYAAKSAGEPAEVEDIISRVKGFGVKLVEITGGEPLAQSVAGELIARLVESGFETLVETNGAVDIGSFDNRAIYIVDIKTPGSGAADSFFESNFNHVKRSDQIKFVITSREDFDWAVGMVRDRGLEERCTLLFSPASGIVEPKTLAKWLLESGVRARLNLQLHKFIWRPDARGV